MVSGKSFRTPRNGIDDLASSSIGIFGH
jgi:hypothetical protein